MQTKPAESPRPKSFRGYHLAKILQGRASDSESVDCRAELGRLTSIPALSTHPLKENLRKARVRRQVVTLATHQEKVRCIVGTAKRAWNDMAALKRDIIPAAQNSFPASIRPFDVVSGAVAKSASPTPRLAPVNRAAQSAEPAFPILEYLCLRRKFVRKMRTN
jgi:hypothetical protein